MTTEAGHQLKAVTDPHDSYAYADIQRRLVAIENQLSWLVSSAKRIEETVERARLWSRRLAALAKHVKW